MLLQRLEVCVLLSVAYFVVISKTRDHYLCNFTEWKLVEQEQNVTKEVLINGGDGQSRDVKVEVDIHVGMAWYNVSYIVEDCCVGYERRGGRDICKACNQRSKTYGRNCLQSCQCDGCRGCDHVTGECIECKAALTTSKTTVTSPSVTNTTTPLYADFDEICDVCREHNNCTTWRCKRAQVTTDSGEDNDNSTTIFLAVISSLGTLTIVIVVLFLIRERYHKQRNNTAIPDNYEIPGRQLYEGLFIANNQEVILNLNNTGSLPNIGQDSQTGDQGEYETIETDEDEEHYAHII